MRLSLPLIIFLPLLIAGLVFYPAISFDFTWLAHSHILERGVILDSWDQFFPTLFGNGKNSLGNFRPMYSFYQTLEFGLWGENPSGHHASSLFLHFVNILLVTLVLKKIRLDNWQILGVVLIWSIIPVSVPAVALLVGKAQLLSTAFILCAFLVSNGGHKFWHLFFYVLFSVLAVLTTEIAISGVVLCALWAHGQKGEWKSYVWLSVIPALVALTGYLYTVSSLSSITVNYGWRIATFPFVYASYFFESMPAIRLTISDATWSVNTWEVGKIVYYFFLLLSSIILQILMWQKIPATRIFILIFNIYVMSVSQILPTDYFRADRFLYVAAIGWIGMFWMTILHFIKGVRWRSLILIVIAGYYFLNSQNYLSVFQDDGALSEHILDHSPDNREAHYQLGKDRLEEDNLSAALAHLTRAAYGDPYLFSHVDEKAARFQLAKARMATGEYHLALELFKTIEGESERFPKLDLYIGICYKMTLQPEMAYEYLVKYQKKYPDELEGMEKMAEIYIDLGQKNNAINELNKILRLYPDHPNRQGISDAVNQLYNL